MAAHQKVREDYQLALNKIEELMSKCNKLHHQLEEVQVSEAETDITLNAKIQDQVNVITALRNELDMAKSLTASQSNDNKGKGTVHIIIYKFCETQNKIFHSIYCRCNYYRVTIGVKSYTVRQ